MSLLSLAIAIAAPSGLGAEATTAAGTQSIKRPRCKASLEEGGTEEAGLDRGPTDGALLTLLAV